MVKVSQLRDDDGDGGDGDDGDNAGCLDRYGIYDARESGKVAVRETSEELL